MWTKIKSKFYLSIVLATLLIFSSVILLSCSSKSPDSPGSASSAKEITVFSINGVSGKIDGTAISLTLPYGTDVTSLTPTITITGVSISPASGVARNFTSSVLYTVAAANSSTQDYTVTVSVALSTAKEITVFSINGVSGKIDGTAISLTLPYGTDVTSLTPTITITGVSISPASGVARNFTSSVLYTVAAADSSTQDYTVTVSVALSTAKEITAFSINGVSGKIEGTAISLTLPYGTDVTSLTPTITITGVSISPASGVVRNFTSSVLYTVAAADSSTQDYTVTVSVALSSEKEITAFSINGVSGKINGTAISLTLPYGTDVTSLTPTITITGVSISPASGVARNFTSSVLYTVAAADSSTQDYTVTVSVALSSEKEITGFSINGVSGKIEGTAISLTLPYGTDVTSLTPTITITGVSISPASGVARNFTSSVLYTVAAADSSTQDYTVTVSVALSSEKEITAFSINGVSGKIEGTAISLTLPYGTDVTSLTPTITITGVSISPASGVARNFTGSVLYTVAAADSSTQDYTVTVSVLSGQIPVYTPTIYNSYPHDSSAYTEGLLYSDGYLYESTGTYGQSTLRKVDLTTGTVKKNIDLAPEYFGEGITLYNNTIVQLTWQSYKGFVYNKDTFELITEFSYSTEGWGITYDGEYLIMSDGSNVLYYLSPVDYSVVKQIKVTANGKAVTNLNELEYINGKIYANVFETDRIAIIQPDGAVIGWIDLEGILSAEDCSQNIGVLNGIAYNASANRIYVTGKDWCKLFEIELVP